jgi:23S rRNA (guanosine2251-2'-O)-methyltransferase
MSKIHILEGAVSILACLAAGHRPIYRIYLQKEKATPAHAQIKRAARRLAVPVEQVDVAIIKAQATGHSHGGAIALVGERRYQPLERLGEQSVAPFVVMLDGVEDPFNFGQAVRALYAAGANGLVTRTHSWPGAEGIIARASAGATEQIATAMVERVEQAVDHFQQRGLLIACTAAGGSIVPLYEANLCQPLFLIIGGERRGIARSILRRADLVLRIPYGGYFTGSLGATSAAAVLAFEVMRQRRYQRRSESVNA